MSRPEVTVWVDCDCNGEERVTVHERYSPEDDAYFPYTVTHKCYRCDGRGERSVKGRLDEASLREILAGAKQ